VDPWTLTGFRVLGIVTPLQKQVMISGHGHNTGHTKPRLGACYEKERSLWISLDAYCKEIVMFSTLVCYDIYDSFQVLLPYSRSMTQIWRDTLITPSWPIGVLPLIFAWDLEHRRSILTNVLITCLLCDCLYWLGHGMSIIEAYKTNVPSDGQWLRDRKMQPILG
jgi:hypothetical protein